jgi:hypothetical protein
LEAIVIARAAYRFVAGKLNYRASPRSGSRVRVDGPLVAGTTISRLRQEADARDGSEPGHRSAMSLPAQVDPQLPMTKTAWALVMQPKAAGLPRALFGETEPLALVPLKGRW